MKALDTNVLARWVLRDDEKQALAADAILRQPCFVSITVMLELGWVLDRSLRLPRSTVAAMLARILDLATLNAENATGLAWSIARYRAGADWADAVHLARTAGSATEFVTFDRQPVRKLGKHASVQVSLVEV